MYLTFDDLIAFTVFGITVFSTGVTVGVKVGMFIAYVSYKNKEK